MVLCSWVTIGPRSGVALAMRHSLSDIQFLRCTWVQCLCKKYEQPFHYRVWCLCFYILLDQLVDALFRHHSFTVEPECHQTNQQTNQPVNFPLFHHGYFFVVFEQIYDDDDDDDDDDDYDDGINTEMFNCRGSCAGSCAYRAECHT